MKIIRSDEYFREWLATFPEELFVILKIYADESTTNKVLSLCGFIATADYWETFSRRWNAVLRRYCAPYFHFREFADKENKWKIKGNPYLHWNGKKRDGFLNELAIVLSEAAVPVGGCLDMAKFRADGLPGDPNGYLIHNFYGSVEHALNTHWANLDGEILFVFDETDNGKWVATLNEYHQAVKKSEKRIGGLSFENDLRCPPLQAADLYAYSIRQIGEKYYAQGKTRQVKRTLDWILSKNQYRMFKESHTYDQWVRLIRLVLEDRRQKKALWAKQGQPKKQYYPELHFEAKKYGFKLIDPIDLKDL